MIILTILGVLLVVYGITTIILYYVSEKWASLIIGILMLFLSSIIVSVDAQDVGVMINLNK